MFLAASVYLKADTTQFLHSSHQHQV